MKENIVNRQILILSFILFIFTFTIYFITLSPDVTFEDSGELITAGYRLAIPHPPGYPLFLILAKLFSFIPVGKIEFRINLMSSFFASLSIVSLFITFFKIGKILNLKQPALSAAFTVILISISTTFWNIATITEVYALNLFLFSIQLYILIKIIEKPKIKYFNFFFYINGIALGNHHTSIFMTISLIFLFLLNKWWKKLKFKNYILFGIFFLLGFSIYIYLPIRAASSPILNWGAPSNIKNFLYVLLRKQYGALPKKFLQLKEILFQLRTVNPLYELYSKTNNIFIFTPISLILIGILLYLVFSGFKKISNKNISLLFLIIFLLYTIFLIILTQTPKDKLFTLKVFLVPAWTIFYFCLSIGIFNVFKNSRWLIFILPVLFILNFVYHYNKNYFYTLNYAENIFKNAKFNSIIFTVKDNETFPLWDLRYVKYKRPDLIIINIVILSEQWYLDQIIKEYKNLKITLPFLKGKYSKEIIRKIFIDNIIASNPEKTVYFTSKNFRKFVKLNYKLQSAGIIYEKERDKSSIQSNIIYYLKFQNLENDFKRFSVLFDSLSVEKFCSTLYYLDTQTKLVLQNCANLLFAYDGQSLYPYKWTIYLNNIIGVAINNIHSYARVGKIFLALNNKRKFEYFYKKAIALQPFSQYAMQLKSELNKLSGSSIFSIIKKAEKFYNDGNFLQAIKYYTEVLKLSPANAKLYSNIGDCYFNLQKYKTAIKYYQKAIELDKNYITPYYNLGGCYIMLGNRKKAIKIWKKGLKISPQNKLLQNAIAKWGIL